MTPFPNQETQENSYSELQLQEKKIIFLKNMLSIMEMILPAPTGIKQRNYHLPAMFSSLLRISC